MPGVFDSKYFNAEVFRRYMERVPNLRLNRLLQSGAIRTRQELAASMRDDVGGNYISTPLRGLIDGAPLNYDGATDITATTTTTYLHSRVVVGRAKAWTELDFSTDITGGVDFMRNVAAQVSRYWDDVDQDTIVAIMKGIFAMTGTGNTDFVTNHTSDITAVVNADGKTGLMDATSINSAVQKASGDNKGIFSMVIVHSVVATNLENANALQRVKITENGITRDTGLATLSGKVLLIDDSMPVDTSGSDPIYTSYVLGSGAIEYTNCGAKVPYEMDRDPKTNGGSDTMYTRQRKAWAPFGISFTKSSMSSASPTNTELANGANWELVHSPTTSGSTQYINHRAIPIARIHSLG